MSQTVPVRQETQNQPDATKRPSQRYTYMNYGQPTYYYQQPSIPTKMRYSYVPTVAPQYVTYVQPMQTRPTVQKPNTGVVVQEPGKQRIGCNSNYLKSPLGLLRLLLIVRIKK